MFNKIREIEKYIEKESQMKELNEISEISKNNISIKLDKQSLLNLLDPNKGEYTDASDLINKKFIDYIP